MSLFGEECGQSGKGEACVGDNEGLCRCMSSCMGVNSSFNFDSGNFVCELDVELFAAEGPSVEDCDTMRSATCG